MDQHEIINPDSVPSSPMDRLVRSEEDIAARASKNKRYSRIVRSMRLAFPVLALAIVAVLMIWSEDKTPIKAVPRAEVSPQTVSRNELVNPKFQSEDSHNQPYSITADKAVQNTGNMDAIILQAPVADIQLRNGNHVEMKAANGEYNQKSGELQLDGAVKMQHNSGYQIETEQMTINVDGQTMSSDSPVTGHGPQADIRSQGLEADGKTDTVIFKGPATLTLTPERTKSE